MAGTVLNRRIGCGATQRIRFFATNCHLVHPVNWSPQTTGPPCQLVPQKMLDENYNQACRCGCPCQLVPPIQLVHPSQLVPPSTSPPSLLVPPVNWFPQSTGPPSQMLKVKSAESNSVEPHSADPHITNDISQLTIKKTNKDVTSTAWAPKARRLISCDRVTLWCVSLYFITSSYECFLSFLNSLSAIYPL